MFLKELYIQNYRGIESQNLEFTDGINLIIGNNGVGKTSVLSAAAISLGFFIRSLESKSFLRTPKTDVRYVQKKIGESIVEFEYKYPVVVKSNMDLNGTLFECGQIIEENSDNLNFRNIKTKNKDELIKLMSGVYPLISYQRFDREWKLKTSLKREKVTVHLGMDNRAVG